MIESNQLLNIGAPTQKSRRYSVHESIKKQAEMCRIICKNSNLALRPQIRQKINMDDEVKIMGSIIDEKSIKQLWMIRPVKEGKNQIINFWTDLNIESQTDGVKLEKRQEKVDQRFEIQTFDKELGQFRIKNSFGLFLSLDGIVELVKGNQQDQSQIFCISQAANPFQLKQFNNTFLILESKKQRCLGLIKPDSTSPTKVYLNEKKDQINQMWLFQPIFDQTAKEDTKYSIINMLNQKRLWPGQKGQLMQADEKNKIWQLRKRHGRSGQLYCLAVDEYLNYDDSINDIVLSGSSNGTKWQLI